MRFPSLLLAVTAAVAVSATFAPVTDNETSTFGLTPVDTLHSRALTGRTITGTGCTCAGLRHSNTRLYNNAAIVLLYSVALGNPNGWCWQNGVMTTQFQNVIIDAINTKKVTPYANGTWINDVCKAECTTCTTSQLCANYIMSLFSSTGTNANLNACTYPSSNFVPINCNCGFNCTSGYSKCGTSSCINPATQNCVSGAPVNKLRKRAVVCPTGLTPCPAYRGFECLDTTADLEACGGCPFEGGDDCSAIPNSDRVQCVQGKCEIISCRRGFTKLNGQCV